MKTMTVISLYPSIAKYYKSLLNHIFNGLLQIRSLALEEVYDNQLENTDLILVTSHIILPKVRSLNISHTDVLIMKKQISQSGLEKLKALPTGSPVLLIGLFKELAEEEIGQIYENGFHNIHFIPVYPGLSEIPRLTTAVTCGDRDWIPDSVTNLIDIYQREISLDTIFTICNRLGLDFECMNSAINAYKAYLKVPGYGIDEYIQKIDALRKQLDIILSVVEDSVIAIDTNRNLILCNDAAEQMLQLKRPLVGHQVQEFISKLGLDIVLKTHRAETSHLSFIQGKQIVSDNYPLIQKDNILGVICISREFQKMESKNRQLRKKLAGSSHRARYTFSDIKGEHSSILKSIEIAKRIAKNDLTILITGESGTGKELFAQSIHNESSRKTFPFLALNCSSISENLLESELFGYEEGAFTGARRNGKRGLLELAEGGTLFLDEIGDMPYPMQAKFLRVLNERQFMRIGGHEVIDFDVRIIAATNKNLRNMILEHEFRKDLFYRLNVFPLELPSLNNRKSDIPLLVQNFLTNKPQKKTVQPDVYQDLMNFYWDGNIRELKNCVDYMYEVSESSTITKNHLPEYIKEKTFLNEKNRFLEEETTIALRSRQEQKQLIFRFIVKMRQTNQRLSREIISQMCQSQGLFLSMSEIRAILSTLEEDGLIVVTTGRNGIKVTEKGWEKATL